MIHHFKRNAAFAAVFLGGFVASQDALPLPARPLAQFEFDMPATLKKEFAGTRLGELLASEEIGQMWASMKAEMERELQDGEEELSPDEKRLFEIFETLEGRVTISMDLEFDFETGDGEPRGVMVFALRSEDAEALDEIERLVADLAEKEAEEPIRDVEVAGRSFLSVETDPETSSQVFLPVRMGDALVMFAGNSLEERVTELLQAERPAAPEGDGTAAIDARADVSRFMTMLIESMEAESRERSEFDQGGVSLTDEPDPRELFGRLRMLGLREFRVTLAPMDEHVVLDLAMMQDPQQPSIFDLFRPLGAGAPDLLSIVPRSHKSWSLSHLRFQEMADMGLDVTRMFMPDFDMAALDAMFGEQFEGLSLSQDFLAHMGDEVLYLADPEAGMDADLAMDPMAAVDGIVLGVELKDPAAFAKSLDQMLRSRGLHAARTTKEYRGIETFEMPLLGMIPLEWAFGSNFMLLGIGPSGAEQTRLVLDAEVARRAGEEPPPFPENVGERLDAMPSDWDGASVTDITPILDMLVDVMETDIDAPPEFRDAFRTLASLVRRYELGAIVSTNTFEDGRVLARTVW